MNTVKTVKTVKLGCDLGMSSVKLVGAAGVVQFLSQAALYGGERQHLMKQF